MNTKQDPRIVVAQRVARKYATRYCSKGTATSEEAELVSVALIGIMESDGDWRDGKGMPQESWRWRFGSKAVLEYLLRAMCPLSMASVDRVSRRGVALALAGSAVPMDAVTEDDNRSWLDSEVADASPDPSARVHKEAWRRAVAARVREVATELSGYEAAVDWMLDESERTATEHGAAVGQSHGYVHLKAFALRQVLRQDPVVQSLASALD
jgi:hypothetical protein